jgi:hypothetical protein
MKQGSTSPGTAPSLTFVRCDEIGRLAALAASYWRSVELAADRGDVLTVTVHIKQVAAVTKSALAVMAELHPGDLP